VFRARFNTKMLRPRPDCSALFLIVGVVYDRMHTREIAGLWRPGQTDGPVIWRPLDIYVLASAMGVRDVRVVTPDHPAGSSAYNP